MNKSFDRKLNSIVSDPEDLGNSGDPGEFILCDSKDSDLARAPRPVADSVSAEWPDSNFPYHSDEAFLASARSLAQDSAVDLVLLSPSVHDVLVDRDAAFKDSDATPAVRVSVPAAIDACELETAGTGAKRAKAPESNFELDRNPGTIRVYGLGLRGKCDCDLKKLDAYDNFRTKAASRGIRHILELYPMDKGDKIEGLSVGDILQDRLVRSIIEGPRKSRPLVLFLPFYGSELNQKVARAIPGVPTGVVGGAPGTTFDAFDLLAKARESGSRAAWFGRKIASAEHQGAFVKFIGLLGNGTITPLEAVHAYHGVLENLSIAPRRKLEEDALASSALLYGDEASSSYLPAPDNGFADGTETPTAHAHAYAGPGGEASPYAPVDEPDFDSMTTAEKLEYNQRKRDRIFG